MNTIFSLTTRDPCSSRGRYSARKLLGYAAIIGIALFGVRAQAETQTIGFDDLFVFGDVSLPQSKSDGGNGKFYKSGHGMRFIARNGSSYLAFLELPTYISPDGVRMIYDPNEDGVPDRRFNLLGLEVTRTQDIPGTPPPSSFYVHAEVDHSSVNGGVYGPLGEGAWGLVGPHNEGLLFVDFARCENCGGSHGGIDNIVYELAAGTVPSAKCNGIPATIVGTSGDDTIFGTALKDVIQGLGGNDTIAGFYGNDRICGGDGDDNLDGGPGSNDRCDGGPHIRGDTATGCETKTNIP